MSNMHFGRYKRFVQYFWDPEPKNHASRNTPIWCLGKRYGCEFNITSSGVDIPSIDSRGHHLGSEREKAEQQANSTPSDHGTECLEDLVNSEKPQEHIEHGWPEDFLDDFESRVFFTYRTHFPAIQELSDPISPKATSSSLRLRRQSISIGGFTSDTGWGCMIRSGQSLLANTLVMLHLGRGTDLSFLLLFLLYLTYL